MVPTEVPNRTYIVSLDPGGTTGIATYYLLPTSQSPTAPGGSYKYSEAFNGTELGPEPHHKKLWAYLTKEHPDIIICENFDIQDSPAVLMISLEYIGVVKLYCELTHTPLHMRPRAFKDVKWANTEALKKIGIYTPGQVHRNDATSHLVHFVVNDLKHKNILSGLRKFDGEPNER